MKKNCRFIHPNPALMIMIICLLFLSYSCKTTMVNTPESFKGKQVILGNGGGFTGLTTTWFILENGQVFKQESLKGEIKKMKKLSKQQTSLVFEKIQALELEKEEFIHPGNMTWFITFKQADNTSVTVKWGDAGYPAPDKYTKYYQQTLSIVQP